MVLRLGLWQKTAPFRSSLRRDALLWPAVMLLRLLRLLQWPAVVLPKPLLQCLWARLTAPPMASHLTVFTLRPRTLQQGAGSTQRRRSPRGLLLGVMRGAWLWRPVVSGSATTRLRSCPRWIQRPALRGMQGHDGSFCMLTLTHSTARCAVVPCRRFWSVPRTVQAVASVRRLESLVPPDLARSGGSGVRYGTTSLAVCEQLRTLCADGPEMSAKRTRDGDADVQVEALDNPELQGKPIAVQQFNAGGFVAVSYEAKAAGVKKGDGVGAGGRANIPHLQKIGTRVPRSAAPRSIHMHTACGTLDVLPFWRAHHVAFCSCIMLMRLSVCMACCRP